MFHQVTVRTQNITLGGFRHDLFEPVSKTNHLCHGFIFGGRIAVVQVQHNRPALAAFTLNLPLQLSDHRL
jgi:hypothetical protein